MKKAVIPGTFDPITNGHLDVIARCSKLADSVVVGVAKSIKKGPLFSLENRLMLANETCKNFNNVEVKTFDGLLVDFVHSVGGDCVVKGLRVLTDFEYEFQMAALNYKLAEDIETLFLMSPPQYMYLSSSQVRELASMGGKISDLVPPVVENALKEQF